MAKLTPRRATVAALVTLSCGCAAGTAVARDSPHWLIGHPARSNGHENDTPTTSTATSTTTTTAGTTTSTSTGATTPPATTAPPTTTAAPTPTPDPAADAAAPQLGRTIALRTAAGTVVVRAPGGPAVPLAASAQTLPTGTRVDTRAGAVVLTSATDAQGTTQTGRFSGGIFEIGQNGRFTQVVLVGGHWAACKAINKTASAAYVGARAVAARTKQPDKPIRRLWGSDDHGRFQTRGRGSVATVRGTRWLTEDGCSGTRTTVTQGAVSVRSRATGRTVTVTAGHSFLAPR